MKCMKYESLKKKNKVNRYNVVQYNKLLEFQMTVVSFESYFDEWTDLQRHKENQKLKRYKVHNFESYVLQPPIYESVSSGEERFLEFERLLENGFPWRREKFQKIFHEMATMVLAEYIAGDDWGIIGPSLIMERGWTAVCSQ